MNLTNYEKTILVDAFYDTVYLLLVTGVFLVILGLVFGFILYFTRKDAYRSQTLANRIVHVVIGSIIDIARSIPFIILMIVLIPATVILVGTMLGANAALPALIISAAPFYARIVYNALRDIPRGNIEALESLGASRWTIIRYLIKESLPSLISGLTVAMVTLVGFIAASGAVGAGGLGELARRYALNQDYKIMYISVGILLLIVFVIQILGDFLAKKVDKR